MSNEELVKEAKALAIRFGSFQPIFQMITKLSTALKEMDEEVSVAENLAKELDDTVIQLNAKTAEVKTTRLSVLERAATDVCHLCGGRELPGQGNAHAVHGPNEAGQYYHVANDAKVDCSASSVWHTYTHEKAS